MSRLLRGSALFLCFFLIYAALPTLAQAPSNTNGGAEAQAPQQHPATGNQAPVLPVINLLQHGVPWRSNITNGPVGFAAPAGAHLTYFGGPVISSMPHGLWAGARLVGLNGAAPGYGKLLSRKA